MSELPPPQFVYMPPMMLRRVDVVGKWLSVFMFISAGLAAGVGAARFHRWQVVLDVRDGKTSPVANVVTRADDMVSNWAGFLGLAGIVVFVLLIIWTYRNVANMRDLGTPARGSNGMAIGGFFIPIANAFIPYRYFKDIAAWLATRGASVSRYSLLPAWWFTYIGGIVMLYTVGSTEYIDTPTFDDLARSEMWGAIAMGVVAVSLVCGGIVIRNMSSGASA